MERFVAQIAPTEEAIVVLSADERGECSPYTAFIQSLHLLSEGDWTHQDLDAAFAAWLQAPDKLGYTDEAVVEILGAGFGQYCARRLNMRWIRLIDRHGTDLGLQGVECDAGVEHTGVDRCARPGH